MNHSYRFLARQVLTNYRGGPDPPPGHVPSSSDNWMVLSTTTGRRPTRWQPPRSRKCSATPTTSWRWFAITTPLSTGIAASSLAPCGCPAHTLRARRFNRATKGARWGCRVQGPRHRRGRQRASRAIYGALNSIARGHRIANFRANARRPMP